MASAVPHHKEDERRKAAAFPGNRGFQGRFALRIEAYGLPFPNPHGHTVHSKDSLSSEADQDACTVSFMTPKTDHVADLRIRNAWAVGHRYRIRLKHRNQTELRESSPFRFGLQQLLVVLRNSLSHIPMPKLGQILGPVLMKSPALIRCPIRH